MSIIPTSVAKALGASGLARSEALVLLETVVRQPRTALLAHPDQILDVPVAALFHDLVGRRVRGEPVAYLTGTREFYGRAFGVDPRVLIPRHETELLVDRALERLSSRGERPPDVLDLGTGSGAIAITLALECRSASVTATDVSAEALSIAGENAAALGADVSFLRGDWYAALDGLDARFDLIVSNPPYVATDDPHLDEGDVRFEPRLALTDGSDGLASLRIVIMGASAHLAPRGVLLVEHGYDQGAPVRALFAQAGYREVDTSRDLAGLERVTGGTAP